MSGLPFVEPYPLPQPDDLPAPVVGWRADPRRAVLLIHDMQEYFLRPFPVGTSPREPLVRNIARLRDHCAALGVPVAYTAQRGGMTPEERGLLADFWGPGMALSAEHRRIVAPLEPAAHDWRFTKWRYSAFFRTDLLERMRATGRDQLLLCGVYAQIGVLATAVDAFTHDVQAFLVGDAVADLSAEEHRGALAYAARRCAAVVATAEVCTSLGARAEEPC
ncbi:isochorismatase family protein [Streptomyces sp. NRRL WC-3742]|uniref:isochorismatase family protein n=1 Tax=Streptomyces sp. NRRL WC-3742 TaxID=1463934 RepID=UPI0004CBEF09|nr:isochorismatase family protein [Streptomyces sp. NRRL WC-3742]